ncbi:MAG: serine hydrolase domain-containing protein [Anaerolineae bacterium]
MLIPSRDTDAYYPPPESAGGWRRTDSSEEARAVAGMNTESLDTVRQVQEWLYGGDSWGIAIIRHGYLVREFYTFNVLVPTRFDIWSGTKSFTGTAWGLLLDDSREGRLPDGKHVALDTPIYPFIPEGYPLSDPRKEGILVRHLLTMTSGIPGESEGIAGIATTSDNGPFELALGRCPNRFGKWGDKLRADPGTHWDYSDLAFAHLGLGFAHITGREMSEVMQERVFAPIGIESLSWDVQGGSGYIGPHTNTHTGIHVSARELARFGYLAMHGGAWAGTQVLPAWWQEMATATSQDLNPSYGYTWWVNTSGTQWPKLPRDAFALKGYRRNGCYIIPSLDLVVARVASGPPAWDDQALIGGIVESIVE